MRPNHHWAASRFPRCPVLRSPDSFQRAHVAHTVYTIHTHVAHTVYTIHTRAPPPGSSTTQRATCSKSQPAPAAT
eukprot:365388-Chlamydomonas_euryale.AAC.7